METRLSLAQLARRHTEEAVQTVINVMGDPEAAHRDRLTAAQIVLDRAW